MSQGNEFPSQESGRLRADNDSLRLVPYDIREHLNPKRLTIIMWDNAFLMRHMPGASFANYDRVLDEAIERGYNTLRLDPMPQFIDLRHPEKELHWPEPGLPFMPWNQNAEVRGPVGLWLIEFMEKLQVRRPQLNYTLSAWWFHNKPGSTWPQGPVLLHRPVNHFQAAEVWLTFLEEWEKRFGFDGCLYVDLANEVPYFLPDYLKTYSDATRQGWMDERTQASVKWLAEDLNSGIALLQRRFPELRFTASIHGDLRWIEVPLDFDCLDVHFYSEADKRWKHRTRFRDYQEGEILFKTDHWHRDFSDACMKTHQSMAPMLRARQRAKLAAFTRWAEREGMPLTTSESWASWFYIDSPALDWGWLLDWASWSVEDALDYQMWGWTPHNYCQPQFKNWQDVAWHQKLTSQFLGRSI